MKLRFYIDSEEKKRYTMNNEIDNQKTKEAHYKFIKIRDAPNQNNSRYIRKN